MKYSTIFKLFVVVILLIVIGFAVQKIRTLSPDLSLYDLGYPNNIELPSYVVIDTLIKEIVLYDTIYIHGEIIYVESDTIAVTVYEPEMEHLSGKLRIAYNYTTQSFLIVNELIVTEYITTKEITKPVILSPKLFRLSISGGYYKGEEGGAISLGVGVTIVDKVSLHMSALSTEMVGVMLLYNF